ncbi:MAG: hypothetical protein U0694_04755 [Anaerolineae bacterium]
MSDNGSEKNAVVVNQAQAEVTTPIIVNLGKKKKKAIKKLKRGKGAAMDEVLDVVDQVQMNLGEQAAGKIIVPVVVVYRKKERRFRGLF